MAPSSEGGCDEANSSKPTEERTLTDDGMPGCHSSGGDEEKAAAAEVKSRLANADLCCASRCGLWAECSVSPYSRADVASRLVCAPRDDRDTVGSRGAEEESEAEERVERGPSASLVSS